jgi:hypothetical protein
MTTVMQVNLVKSVPWRSRRHPVFALLRRDGRHMAWLARTLDPPYSHAHVKAVSAGQWPASARFRAACCALFKRPEGDLFHEHDDSNAPPKEGDIRAGAAVRASYPPRAGVSMLEEAPQTRSA